MPDNKSLSFCSACFPFEFQNYIESRVAVRNIRLLHQMLLVYNATPSWELGGLEFLECILEP